MSVRRRRTGANGGPVPGGAGGDGEGAGPLLALGSTKARIWAATTTGEPHWVALVASCQHRPGVPPSLPPFPPQAMQCTPNDPLLPHHDPHKHRQPSLHVTLCLLISLLTGTWVLTRRVAQIMTACQPLSPRGQTWHACWQRGSSSMRRRTSDTVPSSRLLTQSHPQ
jgi:hypothetical protein